MRRRRQALRFNLHRGSTAPNWASQVQVHTSAHSVGTRAAVGLPVAIHWMIQPPSLGPSGAARKSEGVMAARKPLDQSGHQSFRTAARRLRGHGKRSGTEAAALRLGRPGAPPRGAQCARLRRRGARRHQQIGNPEPLTPPGSVLGQPPIPHLRVSEVTLHVQVWMRVIRPDRSLALLRAGRRAAGRQAPPLPPGAASSDSQSPAPGAPGDGPRPRSPHCPTSASQHRPHMYQRNHCAGPQVVPHSQSPSTRSSAWLESAC